MELEKMFPIVLTALVAVCYSNSLWCDLVFDDIAAIRDNRDLRPHTPIYNIFQNDFWGTPLRKEQSHKSYRPLTVLSFRLNYAIHGLSPFGYHIFNVILHVCVCLLFYRLCLHFLSGASSVVSSALFAVHPVHTEAVSGVVGRAELLSATAFLGALLYYIHHRYQQKASAWHDCGVTSILAVLGLLCKEQALTVLAVCCIYEFATPKNFSRVQNIRHLMLGRNIVSPWWRDKVLRAVILTGAAVIVAYGRWKFMGNRMPVFSRFDNPASVSPSPTRQLTYNYLLAVNAWLLLFPWHLCCDWTMSSIPLVTGLTDVRNLATVVLYAGIFCLIRNLSKMEEESRVTIAMSLALLIIPFIPASNLLFPVGFVVAERVLYIPSMGFCMLVSQGWSFLFDKRGNKSVAVIGIILLLTVNMLRTISRNEDWKNEYSLFSSALSVNQRNGKLFNNMGQVLESMNRQEEALQHYQKAILKEPDDVRSYLNVGRILTNLRRYKEAEDVYRKAKMMFPSPAIESSEDTHVTPNHLQLFLNLAFLISQNDSRLEEADAVQNPLDMLLWYNVISVVRTEKIHLQTKPLFLGLTRLKRSWKEFDYRLDVCRATGGTHTEDFELYREVITLRSDFTNAYLNRGDVLLKMNRTKEAEAMYQIALQHDGHNPDLHFNLGVVLMDQGRNEEALHQFNRALDIEPDHEKSLEFSAVLMHESGIPNHKNLARVRLERIIDRGKETERIYINLGLVAVDNKNFQSAEKYFRKALLKDPTSREALFNLALLLSEQYREADAVLFLEELLQHYPDHINGLLLKADISVNYLRNLDAAEKCYRKVLAIDPTNQKALHNLCVVHFERQDFVVAERCFVHTLTVHPDVNYIRHHLDVVRNILRHGQRRVFNHLANPFS